MKIQKIKNYLKTFQDTTTFRWLKRFHSTLLMVQSVMHTLGITIYSLLKGLLQVVSYLFAGLSLLLIGISIRFVELLKKISFLRLIPTRCTLHLTDLLIVLLKRDMILQELSTHWTVLLKIKLNLLLIRVIQNLLRISTVIPKE